MENGIINRANTINSLQISVIGNINSNNFSISDGKGGKLGFLIKNITDENIALDIIPYGMDSEVNTIIYPGWNVEIVKEVINKVEGLQYGY